MRHRREAKTPRRPRVITWRLVLVSLVVGVVLAVGSVPASLFASKAAWLKSRTSGPAKRYLYNDRIIEATSRYGPTVSLAGWTLVPQHMTGRMLIGDRANDLIRVDEDPRPRRVRAWLDANGGSVHEFSTGWPFLAAYGQSRDSSDPFAMEQTASTYEEVGLWFVSIRGLGGSIPLFPQWPGLLGNTLFYAILALIPLSLLRRRKLRRRARRGLCLACAYELGESVDACPECGLARAAT